MSHIPLDNILKSVAERCNVPIADVRTAALQVGVENSGGSGGGYPDIPLAKSSSQSQFKNPCVPLPEKVGDGAAVDQMTVTELRDVLGSAESAEAAWPFLLRFVLGEFHYGQRVTGLQPGQKPGGRSSARSSIKSSTDDDDTPDVVKQNLKAFDVMAAESRFRHLHQVAGWIDITSKTVWDNYVRDVLNDKIKAGDSVFEAGCGVMAFLTACTEAVPDIVIGGLDGAKNTIALNKERVADHLKDNFFVPSYSYVFHFTILNDVTFWSAWNSACFIVLFHA